jgi:uncharacterized protein (TIGR00725 family)
MSDRYVAVIGAAEATPDEAEAAAGVGRLLAEAGAVLVCGGLGGVMEAAARGCREAGGTSVGLLPGETRAGANPYLTAAIATGMGEARNALVVRAAGAVIAIGGGFGTLSEIGLALKMGRPVIGLASWDLPDPAARAIVRVDTPEEAVRAAMARTGP